VRDLFGQSDDSPDCPPPRPKQRGHAAPPGTGPEGETCRTCKHLARLQYAKVYLKCELRRPHWTGGAKTDIKARWAACSRWEPAAAVLGDTLDAAAVDTSKNSKLAAEVARKMG
jgi:hypothetical protein